MGVTCSEPYSDSDTDRDMPDHADQDDVNYIMNPVHQSPLNWWEINIQPNVDDASTEVFSDIEILADDSEDSVDDLMIDAVADPDAATIEYPIISDSEDASSHGTVEDFIQNETCKICNIAPSATDAVEINDRWMHEGNCVMLIYGTTYVKCSKCFTVYHMDCLQATNRAPQSPETVADTWECYECIGNEITRKLKLSMNLWSNVHICVNIILILCISDPESAPVSA